MTAEQNKSPPRYTPEPWQYDPETGFVYSLDRTLICYLCPNPDFPIIPEVHANGFLIDVAPNLFERGERAVAAFDMLKPLLPEHLKAEAHRLSMAIEGLRDAVAQAQHGLDWIESNR